MPETMKMNPSTTVIAGDYLRDLLDQPAALADTQAMLRTQSFPAEIPQRLAQSGFDRVILTGMGSSLHALQPLRLRLAAAGHAPFLIETSELVHALPGLVTARTLLIIVSQSGASAETVRLLEQAPSGCYRVGVTNTPGSPLAQSAHAVVYTRAGHEASVACKTYLTALIALDWLGAGLLGEDIGRIHDDLGHLHRTVAGRLEDWAAQVAAWQAEMRGARCLFLAGRGVSLATVGSGGLILKESSHFPAEGLSSAAFRHGPLEMLGPDVALVVLAGAANSIPLNRRLAQDSAKAGGKVVLLDPEAPQPAFKIPEVPDRLLPVVEMLPVQMLSLALAALAGREAGRFEHGSKVTTIE